MKLKKIRALSHLMTTRGAILKGAEVELYAWEADNLLKLKKVIILDEKKPRKRKEKKED